jgi:hypothetical protein
MTKNKRLESIEDRLGSGVKPIEITVEVIAMDGTVGKTFIVKDGRCHGLK